GIGRRGSATHLALERRGHGRPDRADAHLRRLADRRRRDRRDPDRGPACDGHADRPLRALRRPARGDRMATRGRDRAPRGRRRAHAQALSLRSTSTPTSGNTAAIAKPAWYEAADTTAAKAGGTTAPAAARLVCCMPSAAPLRARPAISAAAVYERPFHAIAVPPATISAATRSVTGACTRTATTPRVTPLATPTVRSGLIREPTRSDQRPPPIRSAAASTWIPASTAAASPREKPRSS